MSMIFSPDQYPLAITGHKKPPDLIQETRRFLQLRYQLHALHFVLQAM